jgi:sugar O-acyltransferase (sialic acid O-acetyltransferase NeuD family)
MIQKDLIILGTGGNCLDILDAVLSMNETGTERQYRVIGFLDDDSASHGKEVCGLPVLGALDMAPEFAGCSFVNGIGSPRNFWRKPSIIGRTRADLDRFATVVHPAASLSRFATLGPGTVLLQHVTVNARARLGAHVLVLPGAVISHDAELGDYTTVASGACVAGAVRVAEGCYLGAKCAINTGVKLGRHCLVGMGAVVLRDADECSVVAGNPARKLRNTY